ncbi:ribokinase [Neobacillus sp. WH10]|uniref:ribokinase n=1 Tax=Neobacillus sp. WH10 TaxID=3047873 RepID=UPI0024C1C920|nr:ribokinase [Neobacillus sp. WH10]WHY77149.1 ribokinase [Neobacillus sp. WH10]
MNGPKVTVIGSMNMDLVVKTAAIPKLGETVFGQSFSTLPGGKGANQAVACARLGADVKMVGCVGNDAFGTELIATLRNEGVNTSYVEPVPHCSTGIASINVQEGDNSIIVVPGANFAVTREVVAKAEEAIKQADIVLLQLEIPLDAVTEAVNIANKYKIPVIVNPAPAQILPKELVDKITYLTPNEYELAILITGQPVVESSFNEMMSKLPGKVVMTKGSNGAYFVDHNLELYHQQAFKVEAVDTTGAGDTFNAVFAVQIAKGNSVKEAMTYAAMASAISVTKFGAQGGMPTAKDVDEWKTKLVEAGR